MDASLRKHLAFLLENTVCGVHVDSRQLLELKKGTIPRPELESIVSRMKTAGCGTVSKHKASENPESDRRTAFLKDEGYHVQIIPDSDDNVFQAVAHGVSVAMYHHKLEKSRVSKAVSVFREGAVSTVLKDTSLQKRVQDLGSLEYHRQFLVRNSATRGQMSWVSYAQKMKSSAKGTYPELAAMAQYSNIEIHVYTRAAGGYKIQHRYSAGPKNVRNKGAYYLVRLLQGDSIFHFDLLVPKVLSTYQIAASKHATFWDLVDTHLLKKGPSHAINTPNNARKIMNASKNNRNMNSNLPNNANIRKTNNFKWTNSPALG